MDINVDRRYPHHTRRRIDDINSLKGFSWSSGGQSSEGKRVPRRKVYSYRTLVSGTPGTVLLTRRETEKDWASRASETVTPTSPLLLSVIRRETQRSSPVDRTRVDSNSKTLTDQRGRRDRLSPTGRVCHTPPHPCPPQTRGVDREPSGWRRP